MSNSFPSLTNGASPFPLPTISEDTLDYTIHLPPSLDPAATALLITQYVESLLLQPWLWNKDSWELKVVEDTPVTSAGSSSGSSTNGGKLEGRMRVGDAVDDEWLVVWLLREVSRKWPELVISVRDTDGQFLLIEAANDLPAWVSPENAENRLWLHSAHLHLLPLSVRSSSASRPKQLPDDDNDYRQYDPEAWLNEVDAVRAVRTGKYGAEEKMERAVWNRIACYPEGLKTHQHRTKAYLPVSVAKALAKSPELVQKAVEGFYVRDPAQLRAASRMTHFPPSPSVLTPITLTRAAYAQLQGQVFHPPRIFGPEWHVRDTPGSEGERRWRDLGVKIATGFEIMYREGGKKSRSGESGGVAESLKDDAEYRKFLDNLKTAGWFGEELEGSQRWKEREEEARKGYQGVKSSDTASQRPSFAFLVDCAVQSASDLPADSLSVDPSAEEDSESWLEVSPDELDGMMMRASGRAPAETQTTDGKVELGEEHGQALQDLAKKVEEFVGGQGDIEGARFVDELSDDDMDEDISDDDSDDEATTKETLEAEKETRLQNLVPGLSADDWGRRMQPESEMKVAPETKPDTKKETKVKLEDLIPSQMRPPRFAKQEFDGAVSDSDDESDDEADLPPAGTIGRQIAQMKWGDGADRSAKIEEMDQDKNDDDEDEEAEDRARRKKLVLGDDIDDEIERRVWGKDNEDEEPQVAEGEDEGMDVDMDDEQEEFLKFSREALGITDEMWEGILGDRRARGAFVPSASKPKADSGDKIPSKLRPKTNTTTEKKVQFSAPTAAPQVVVEDGPNTALDSFETVMRAMEEELAKTKPSTTSNAKSTSTGKGQKAKPKSKPSMANPLPSIPTEADLDEMDEDDLIAMDRELRAALKGAGVEDDDLDGDEDVEEAKELEGEDRREYEMMRDFLESYKSQGGGSGVVGNLFGRLGEGKGK
ncbi:hypothetical protein CI109_106899 [Kwoniella shandongensis]|uniref:Uncharacterized protein n=1 Tax=Kwoniella shandongensis TaxID=1734106 RepID=A0A5M6CB56_9TREE|nr:uncharacterized protein CI109_000845 [Kwoniella shandongensis]KAA5530665.1 hypothetical protein CI109_000845 [Kwoniella shandongensis]